MQSEYMTIRATAFSGRYTEYDVPAEMAEVEMIQVAHCIPWVDNTVSVWDKGKIVFGVFLNEYGEWQYMKGEPKNAD